MKKDCIYYVYLHRHPENGEVFYVGKGKKDRAWSFSGRDEIHLKMLNKLVDDGYTPEQFVEIHRKCLPENEALNLEKMYIWVYLDTILNKQKPSVSPEIICKAYKKGMTQMQISKEYNCGLKTVRAAILYMGEKPRKPPRFCGGPKKYSHSKIRSMYKEGHSISDISAHVGCSQALVFDVLKKTEPSFIGYPKYDPKEIYDIWMGSGKSQKYVIEKTGVSSSHLYELIRQHKKNMESS